MMDVSPGVPMKPRVSIHSLPAELLGRIFVMGKYDEELERFQDRDERSYSQYQNGYAQVSVYFRNVALGTATLWTVIAVDSFASLDLVNAYCSRSSSAPLDIRVKLRSGHRIGIFEILAVVVAQSHRWRKLTISMNREVVSRNSVIGLLCNCSAPILEHLSLSVDSVDMLNATVARSSPKNPTILNASKISFLRFRGLSVHLFRPPLEQLTILHLDQTSSISITYVAFKELLTASVNLAHLSVYGDTLAEGQWPVFPIPSMDIPLPSLRSLRIRGNDGAVFAGILMNIDAPLLHSLVLKEMQDNDLVRDWVHPQFPVIIPQLKELTFCDFDPSEMGYRTVFRLFPSIETFYLPSSTLGFSRVFRALCELDKTNYLKPPQPWPRLQTMGICFDQRDDPFLVEELFQDRQKLGCPLAELQFVAVDAKLVQHWLEGLNAEGGLHGACVTTISGFQEWPACAGMVCLDYDDTLFD